VMLQIVVGEQDLRDGEAEGAKKLFVHRHQAGLADGGARLQFGQVAGAFLVTERAHARAHRPGTHEHDLAAGLALSRDLGNQLLHLGGVRLLMAVGQNPGSEFHDQPGDILEHFRTHWDNMARCESNGFKRAESSQHVLDRIAGQIRPVLREESERSSVRAQGQVDADVIEYPTQTYGNDAVVLQGSRGGFNIGQGSLDLGGFEPIVKAMAAEGLVGGAPTPGRDTGERQVLIDKCLERWTQATSSFECALRTKSRRSGWTWQIIRPSPV
jgi:hypothetical protein